MTARLAVVALVIGPKCRARIRGALTGRADVHFCELRAELLPLAAVTQASAIIAEPRDRDGEDVSTTVGAVRGGLPSVPVIAYIAGGDTSSSDILAMPLAKIHPACTS